MVTVSVAALECRPLNRRCRGPLTGSLTACSQLYRKVLFCTGRDAYRELLCRNYFFSSVVGVEVRRVVDKLSTVLVTPFPSAWKDPRSGGLGN
jgi:hypothetical protein